jgi:molybdopterin-biosynthesis enzyme MoeA-like protein
MNLVTSLTGLAKQCFKYGLNLLNIAVIPDDVKIISETVAELSKKYDMVFTSGGIGSPL